MVDRGDDLQRARAERTLEQERQRRERLDREAREEAEALAGRTAAQEADVYVRDFLDKARAARWPGAQSRKESLLSSRVHYYGAGHAAYAPKDFWVHSNGDWSMAQTEYVDEYGTVSGSHGRRDGQYYGTPNVETVKARLIQIALHIGLDL